MNDRGNQIANYLTYLGVTSGSRVILLLELTPEFISAFIGILKAGCIIIPMSAGQADPHLQNNIDTLLPDMVITSKKWSTRIALPSKKSLVLENERERIDRVQTTPPGVSVSPENMAFILKSPVGNSSIAWAMIAHYALVSHARSAIDIYDIIPADKILVTGERDSAAFTGQVFLGLFSGAALVLPPWKSLPSPLVLINFCETEGVTVLEVDKGYWQRYLSDHSDAIPDSLKLLIIDVTGPETGPLKPWDTGIPTKVRTLATYGSAETIGAAFCTDISSAKDGSPYKLPIGQPFPGVCLEVLNRFRQPALPNTDGELYIGGIQLAYGYYNSSIKTSASFRKMDFMGNCVRFFKTRKSVRRYPDGRLSFKRPSPNMNPPPNYDLVGNSKNGQKAFTHPYWKFGTGGPVL